MSQPSSEGCPEENGLTLEAPLQKSSHRARKKTSWKKEKKLDLERLPVTSKRSPYAGPVGEKANQMKRLFA